MLGHCFHKLLYEAWNSFEAANRTIIVWFLTFKLRYWDNFKIKSPLLRLNQTELPEKSSGNFQAILFWPLLDLYYLLMTVDDNPPANCARVSGSENSNRRRFYCTLSNKRKQVVLWTPPLSARIQNSVLS